MGRVSPKLVGQNKYAPALPLPSIYDKSINARGAYLKIYAIVTNQIKQQFSHQTRTCIYSSIRRSNSPREILLQLHGSYATRQ